MLFAIPWRAADTDCRDVGTKWRWVKKKLRRRRRRSVFSGKTVVCRSLSFLCDWQKTAESYFYFVFNWLAKHDLLSYFSSSTSILPFSFESPRLFRLTLAARKIGTHMNNEHVREYIDKSNYLIWATTKSTKRNWRNRIPSVECSTKCALQFQCSHVSHSPHRIILMTTTNQAKIKPKIKWKMVNNNNVRWMVCECQSFSAGMGQGN